MNIWGVLITAIGFLLLYMGIKNKSTTDLVNAFRPQAATTTTPSTTAPSNVNPVNPPNGAGTNPPTNVPPQSLQQLLGGL